MNGCDAGAIFGVAWEHVGRRVWRFTYQDPAGATEQSYRLPRSWVCLVHRLARLLWNRPQESHYTHFGHLFC